MVKPKSESVCGIVMLRLAHLLGGGEITPAERSGAFGSGLAGEA